MSPKQVPSAKASRLPLPAYMLHSLAHVELNAVDLAWDTVARFAAAPLPRAFFLDFARVADDESRHLLWCLQRLGELGHAYGDMPAHSVLWEGAQASAGGCLVWRWGGRGEQATDEEGDLHRDQSMQTGGWMPVEGRGTVAGRRPSALCP